METIEIKLENVTFSSDEAGRWSVDDKLLPFLNGRIPESDVIETLQSRAAKGSKEAKEMLIRYFPMVGFHS